MKNKPAVVAGVVDNIRRIFQVVNEQSKKVEHETGLKGSQLWAIKMLAEVAPVKVSELANRMYLHPATVVGVLDRLESRGLVQRERSKMDRRVVHVDLTEKGRELVRHSPEVAQDILIRGLESLNEPKLQKISEGLAELVRILGVQRVPPKLIRSSLVNAPGRRARLQEAEA